MIIVNLPAIAVLAGALVTGFDAREKPAESTMYEAPMPQERNSP
jgi:hypothetical protein